MASATPDLRLPSQPQNITAHWPVPKYCLVTEANGCEQLARSCYPAMHLPGVEPATSRSEVQRPTLHYRAILHTVYCLSILSVFFIVYHSSRIRFLRFFEVSCQKNVKNVESVFQVLTFLYFETANEHFHCKTMQTCHVMHTTLY